MDILDVNDTCKRPISLQKHLYLICQAKLFRDPKLHSSAPNGVATHSLRSPVVSDVSREQHNLCDCRHPLLLFK